ncbi:unnamed protein product [Bemisia tabaci]|uniref:Thioredoxin domain-containing protein n=1 Tax=Bemisia tabaci TaxID=7038 RepID=A0A9P0AK24_BEMTA|nr:PREDICTED: uncharacterized protein LOC109034961 [Bemisia tabaci]CAH0394738.1 unnamed protein product [Bemisia tabaci]
MLHVLSVSIFLLSCLTYVSSDSRNGLQTVNDDELLDLYRSESYVVVLFVKKNCGSPCEKYENEILKIREDLVDSLNAWVVKVEDSQLLRLYSPESEPQLVFVRHGVPLLYDDEIIDDLILHTFTYNKDPAVKELNDDNFEHLTQAASGATTGDWFVMFYSTDCVECQRLQARWETVGAKLRTKMNVARVNRQTTGRVTCRRFGVFEVPVFIFFRHGKLYRYNLSKLDAKSLVQFASDWYRNVRAEPVPHPKTPFDDFTQMIADYLKENPWTIKLVSAIISLITLVSVYFRFKPKKQKKSKSTSSSKSSSASKSKSSKTSEQAKDK